jgi:hypothetical protein
MQFRSRFSSAKSDAYDAYKVQDLPVWRGLLRRGDSHFHRAIIARNESVAGEQIERGKRALAAPGGAPWPFLRESMSHQRLRATVDEDGQYSFAVAL